MARQGTRHHETVQQQVALVRSMRLRGEPRTLIVDPWAVLTLEGEVPPSLLAMLTVLMEHERIQCVVWEAQPGTADEVIRAIPGARASTSLKTATLHCPAIAIVSTELPLPEGTYAWYVGPDEPPRGYHPVRHDGVRATEELLALFGTAIVQERAGFAFRAAGAGKEIPVEGTFDPCILDGISRAMMRPRHLPIEQRDTGTDLDNNLASLVGAALPPILAAQGDDGAIAAAPPPHGPGDPDYWFFWQRDAAQTVLALSLLARRPPSPDIRHPVRQVLARYVHYVRALPQGEGIRPEDLGVSRFEMNGRPIRSYGNPQNDGPAETVLAVLSCLGVDAASYTVVRPYLTYLMRAIDGPSFGPWELAAGETFYAWNLARKALRAGARLARTVSDDAEARRYDAHADALEGRLLSLRDPVRGYFRSGRNFLQPFINTTSGLDIGVLGSVLTAYDVEDAFLNVEDPAIERTMKELERVYVERWPVNVAWQRVGNAGMGMGRFPEDANDGVRSTGGNPWTFATLWAAQYYLRLAERLDFLHAHDPHGTDRVDLLDRADGYLSFVLAHLPPDALTEQIDGDTGRPRGARKLTWAQASLIQTLLLREMLRH